jgi:trehalose-phosphatase
MVRGVLEKTRSDLTLVIRQEELEKKIGKLEKNLSSINGVFIEDKGFSLSVHYRSANKKAIPSIMSEFYTSLLLHEVRNDVLVKTGKMTLEIMPPIAWDKGKAVLWLLARRKFALRAKNIKVLPIYIGDDITDEDVFISLQGRGITVFVGKPKKTKARFYIKDSFEVAIFLKSMLEILSGGSYGKNNKR